MTPRRTLSGIFALWRDPTYRSVTVCRSASDVPVVAIACLGAGLVGRGYESFATELASTLQSRDEIVAVLLCGGAMAKPIPLRVPTIPRHGRVARILQRLRISRTLTEQVSLSLSRI